MSKELDCDFGSDHYNPVAHLASIFPDPQSLTSSLVQVTLTLHNAQLHLQEEIYQNVECQLTGDAESIDTNSIPPTTTTTSNTSLSSSSPSIVTSPAADSLQRICEAQCQLNDLFSRIENVRADAALTEKSISHITSDIKRLDVTKRNLSQSMTLLKRLQMFSSAFDQLRYLSQSSTRQYREAAKLLPAVLEFTTYFRAYRSVDQIASLCNGVAYVQRELLESVCQDFDTAFSSTDLAPHKELLSEACFVVDALGEHAQSRIVAWYCNSQLREYRVIFCGSGEASSFDNIPRRYAWFNRLLQKYGYAHSSIFPSSWKIPASLARNFAEITYDDLKSVFQHTAQLPDDDKSLDVAIFLETLQATLQFEVSIEIQFGSSCIGHTISQAFEPYMNIWIDSLNRQLSNFFSNQHYQKLGDTGDDDNSHTLVHSSSTDLFKFYRQALDQCTKLNTGARLMDICELFACYLRKYAQQILLGYLNDKKLGRLPTIREAIRVLVTADYSYSTTLRLEDNIKSNIHETLREKINLQDQADDFMGVANAAIRILVRHVDTACQNYWKEMRQISWGKLSFAGDQSSYMSELTKTVSFYGKDILEQLEKLQYKWAFCDQLVDMLINSFLGTLAGCRPICEIGAEQLLLDFYGLKKTLMDMAELIKSSNAVFLRRIKQLMTRVDGLLKCLQVESYSAVGLVDAYLLHIGDKSESNFRKLLDLKGIRRGEQNAFVEQFRISSESKTCAHLPAQSAFMNGIHFGVNTTTTINLMSVTGIQTEGNNAYTLPNVSQVSIANRNNMVIAGTGNSGGGLTASRFDVSSIFGSAFSHTTNAIRNSNEQVPSTDNLSNNGGDVNDITIYSCSGTASGGIGLSHRLHGIKGGGEMTTSNTATGDISLFKNKTNKKLTVMDDIKTIKEPERDMSMDILSNEDFKEKDSNIFRDKMLDTSTSVRGTVGSSSVITKESNDAKGLANSNLLGLAKYFKRDLAGLRFTRGNTMNSDSKTEISKGSGDV